MSCCVDTLCHLVLIRCVVLCCTPVFIACLASRDGREARGAATAKILSLIFRVSVKLNKLYFLPIIGVLNSAVFSVVSIAGRGHARAGRGGGATRAAVWAGGKYRRRFFVRPLCRVCQALGERILIGIDLRAVLLF